MKTTILIASWSRDLEYLKWCLKSIQKFATGFDGITLIVPNQEYELFWKLGVPVDIKTYERVGDSKKWQIQAQCQKCLADQHCPNADFILHMDSDCIFTEPVKPEDYFTEGKPVMLIEAYTRLGYSPWKAVTEAVLKQSVAYETMRRHPQVNPIGVYADLRAHIELTHKTDFESFVLSRKADFPWGFSEHNAIGAFALSDPKWKSQYHWIDAGKNIIPKEKVKQFWSLSAIDQPQGTPHDKDTVTPLQICKKIVG